MQNSIYTAINAAVNEIQKVIIGKQDVIRKVMMSILANGHILLDDVPGVGKTTLAVALGKTLGTAIWRSGSVGDAEGLARGRCGSCARRPRSRTHHPRYRADLGGLTAAPGEKGTLILDKIIHDCG